MLILLHSSKTMRPLAKTKSEYRAPKFIDETTELVGQLKSLSSEQLQQMMKIGPDLAETTRQLIMDWTADSSLQRSAVDSFLGDIYSGLQVGSWSAADHEYASGHLRILSGLYGILRPLDGIAPYRLEMGYKIPGLQAASLYEFWGDKIASTLPKGEPILNLTAVEYGKTVTKYIDKNRVTAPQFLTTSTKKGQPIFVAVHTKIARGALANWCIKNRISRVEELKNFDELGYKYDVAKSSPTQPVFVCESFQGQGLSIRLS